MLNSKTILTRSSSKLKTDNTNNTNIINTLLLAASALNDDISINDKSKSKNEDNNSTQIA